MKGRKMIVAGILAAAVFCQSIYAPGLAGMGTNILSVEAAFSNVALSKEVTSFGDASEVLAAIDTLTVSEEDTTLEIPQPSDDYVVEVYGSEVKNILALDGSISPYHIGDRSFNVILEATNKSDESDTAQKSFTLTVPDNTSLYSTLFPEVDNPNETPSVLPSIQEWYGYEGDFTLTADTRIVVNDAAGLGIRESAQEMQEDIEDICGLTLEIVEDTDCTAADIYLESQTTDVYGTGDEGYFIVNGDEGIRIYSSTKTGILYGTVTIEQILYQDDGNDTVPKGVIRDYPLYSVRGIMMDVARIPTRLQFLEDYTKIFKWYKINQVQYHLNDNQWSDPAYSGDPDDWTEVEASHRLESSIFPSLAMQDSKFETSTDNEGRYDYYYNVYTGTAEKTGEAGELYYTKEEFVALQEEASARGITVVAELDTPSHSASYTKYVYNNQEEVIKSLVEYGYLDADEYLDADGNLLDGVSFYINNPNNFELLSIDDESSDEEEKQNAINAKIFMTALFEEYLDEDDPTFLSDVVSAGVDEYWDKGTTAKKEAFRRYMNFMQELIGEKYGKTVYMWGALSYFPGNTEVSKDIVLEIWNTSEDAPLTRIAEGYSVVNVPQPYLYTTPGRYHKDMINEEYIYENWDPTIFNGSIATEKGETKLLGAMGALWGDENREGITEADLNERYLRLTAMVSEKTWGGATGEDNSFVDYSQKFDSLREGPGTQIANDIDSETNVVLDYDFENVSDDGTVIYDQSGNGYNGTITGGEVVTVDGEAMLKFDGDTTIETPLTSLGYPYTISFDVYLDGTGNNTTESSLFSGYDGRLQIAGIEGSLSLNRDYFSQSFDYTVESSVKHTITIVGTYQVTKLYVDGVFTKILYAAASDENNGGSLGASTWTDADNNYRTTFVFPLNIIGDGFEGYMGNIKAYNKSLFPEEMESEGSMSGEVDLARNQGAYADRTSISDGNSAPYYRLYPAWKATDGDGHVTVEDSSEVTTSNESRWRSSNNATDWLMVDLGESRTFSKVVIDWGASAYATAYDIQVSDDGENWTTVKSVTGNTSAWTEDSFAETTARYVKMQGVTGNSNYYFIYEIKVYGTVDKTSLENTISDAETIVQDAGLGWDSTGAAQEFYNSVVVAKAALGDVMAGQEDIDEAEAELKQAVSDWNQYLADREKADEQKTIMLEKAAEAEALLSQENAYEAESWAVFEAAYRAVQEAGDELSAEAYQALAQKLAEAMQGLVKKADNASENQSQTGNQQTAAVTQLAAPAVKTVKSTATKVKVTWEASANAESYQLYRKVGSKVTKVDSPVTGTTAYDTSPLGGKNMSYYVVALAGSQTAYTDSAAGSAKSIKLPKATGKVTATQQSGKKAVTIKWKKVKKASSYIIYRSETKNGKYKKIAAVKKGTTYTDKKVKSKKTYYYKVVTVSSKKYSPMKAAKKAVKVK